MCTYLVVLQNVQQLARPVAVVGDTTKVRERPLRSTHLHPGLGLRLQGSGCTNYSLSVSVEVIVGRHPVEM